MTVYVDDMKTKYGRMKMSHMIADSETELLEMADRIGVDRKWHQYPGTSKSHFDVCMSRANLAIKLGAKPITMKQLTAMTIRRRITKELGPPEKALEWLKELNKRLGYEPLMETKQ